MKNNRLTPLHVYLIGGFMMLLVGLGMWFFMIRPINLDNERLEGEVRGLESTQKQVDGQSFGWNQVQQAEETLAAAEARRDAAKARLTAVENSKHPAAARIDLRDGSDEAIISSGTLSRWLTLPGVVIPTMERFKRQHAARHNVRVVGGFQAPTLKPDARSIPRDIIAWQLGQLQVTGKFNDVMAWARGWNRAPFLVAVDGLNLSLADRRGVVTTGCTITVYMFPRGQAAQSTGGGGQVQTGGGGMGGGMSMGMGGGNGGGGGMSMGMGGGNGGGGMPMGGGGNGGGMSMGGGNGG
ncbi:MAG: hypothetical protein ACK47B_00825 [Armatimonadota bacterium]